MERTLEPFFTYYIASWMALCLVAVVIGLRRRTEFVIGRRAYWHFLAEPWKLLTFVAGASLVTLVAPYTTDPTWDRVDGFFMSVFCFTTAPWVVGVMYARARGEGRWAETYVAMCVWLFSVSWSYDIYLVWRDGEYPLTWFANIFASSAIYLGGGCFWNLEWQRGRGVIFSFMRDGWPSRPAETAHFRLMGYGLILALPVIIAVAMFLG